MTLAQLTKWVEELWKEGLGPEDGIFLGDELDPIIGGAILRHAQTGDRIAMLITSEEDMLRASIQSDETKRLA